MSEKNNLLYMQVAAKEKELQVASLQNERLMNTIIAIEARIAYMALFAHDRFLKGQIKDIRTLIETALRPESTAE